MPFAGVRGIPAHSSLFAAAGGELSFDFFYLNQ
jgi:hypothetical protein